MTASRRTALLDAWIVPALLALMFTLTVAGSWNHSATYDEPYHLGAGVARVALGDHRLAPDHPPLAQDLAAFAALPRIPEAKLDLRSHPAFPHLDPYAYGRALLFEGERETGDAALRRGRAAIAAISLLGAFLTWFVARQLVGAVAARVALLVLALDPTWLAHGGLVTTDMAAAVGFLAVLVTAAYAFAPAPTRASAFLRAGLFALACAALFLSKFSAPLIVPVLALVAAAAWFVEWRSGRGVRALLRIVAWFVLAVTVTIAAIWAAYGFRFSAVADPVRDEPYFMTAQQLGGTEGAFAEMLAPKGEEPSRLRAPLTFARDHHLLPEAYVYGLAEAIWTTRTRASFLMGEHFETGRPAYFPISFVAKTPGGLLLLLLIGGVALIARRRVGPAATLTPSSARRLLLVGGLVFVAVYTVASLTASINIGHRHLLPLAPWCALLASAAWSRATFRRDDSDRAKGATSPPRSRFSLVKWGALAWLAFANGRAFPEYLGSFNEFVGGPSGGRKLLVDSNVDWGQDLARLAEWQEREHVDELLLSRFGTAPPEFYGVRARELPSQQPFGALPVSPWQPGVYAIAATQFQSVYFIPGRRAAWDESAFNRYARLAQRDLRTLAPREEALLRDMSFGQLLILLRDHGRAPDAEVGTSFLIFRLGADEMAKLREESLHPR